MKILWKQLRSRIARKIYPEIWDERGSLRYRVAELEFLLRQSTLGKN